MRLIDILQYKDFYCIADYANAHWKGGFAPIEIAENAYNYLCEFAVKQKRRVSQMIQSSTCSLILMKISENGEELEDVKEQLDKRNPKRIGLKSANNLVTKRFVKRQAVIFIQKIERQR